MNAVTEKSVAFRDWYNRNVLLIIGAILAMTLASLVIGVVGTFVNSSQSSQRAADNKRRDEQTAAVQAEQQRLLDCFDEYAAAQSTSSIEVREASAKKDIATAAAWTALNAEGEAFLAVTAGILKQEVTPAQFEALNDSLARRAEAGKVLEQAQADLDKARAENPIPPPPSEFCAD